MINAFIEITLELLTNLGQKNPLDSKRVDKHIEELQQYHWFHALYENENYHHLFFGNKRVRKYLRSTYRTKRLISQTKEQKNFQIFLDKQIRKQSLDKAL